MATGKTALSPELPGRPSQYLVTAGSSASKGPELLTLAVRAMKPKLEFSPFFPVSETLWQTSCSRTRIGYRQRSWETVCS